MRVPRLSHIIVVCAAAGSVLLNGCGGSPAASASAADAPVVNVTGMDNMKFDPSTIQVKAGQPVNIAFKNGGIIPHDFVTTGADTNVKLLNVPSGQTKTATFLANKPGTYQVICNQPGHKEAGMVAQIVVS